jgi:hypothetical protein
LQKSLPWHQCPGRRGDAAGGNLLAHTTCADFHSAASLTLHQGPVDYKVPPDLSSIVTLTTSSVPRGFFEPPL